MNLNDPHDFTNFTAEKNNKQQQSGSENSSKSTVEVNTVSNSGSGSGMSFFKFLMSVGAAITFIRNFVFNLIFILLAIALFGILSLTSSIDEDASDNSGSSADKEIHPLVTLDLDGPVSQMPEPDDDYSKILKNINENLYNLKEHNILSIEKALKNAASNPNVKTLFVNVSSLPPTSMDVALRIRAAIEQFQKYKGKKSVIVFSKAYTPAGYLISSVAGKVIVDPLGGLTFNGMASSNLYISDLLERFKIEPLVFRAGAYKSAVEPLISNHMSDDVKKEYDYIINSLWNNYLQKLSIKNVKAYELDRLTKHEEYYLHMLKREKTEARLLKRMNLVTDINSEQELKFELIKQYGHSKQSHYEPLATDYRQFVNDDEKPAKSKKKTDTGTIAVVYGIDEITDESENYRAFTPACIRSQLEQIADNPNVKGVILYLNSGGGSVSASEDIRIMISNLRQKGIKVYVSMNSVTASGAYWISTAANKLYASDDTITGSIGVFAVSFAAHRLLNEYGVYEDGVQTSELAKTAIARPMPQAQKDIYAQEVASIYGRFIELVKQSRLKMRHLAPEVYAEGRVFTAQQALSMHMIDKIGSLENVIADMKKDLSKSGHVKKINVIHLSPKATDNMGIFKNLFSASVSGFIPNQYLKALFESLKNTNMSANQKPKMMAIAPYDVKY